MEYCVLPARRRTRAGAPQPHRWCRSGRAGLSGSHGTFGPVVRRPRRKCQTRRPPADGDGGVLDHGTPSTGTGRCWTCDEIDHDSCTPPRTPRLAPPGSAGSACHPRRGVAATAGHASSRDRAGRAGRGRRRPVARGGGSAAGAGRPEPAPASPGPEPAAPARRPVAPFLRCRPCSATSRWSWPSGSPALIAPLLLLAAEETRKAVAVNADIPSDERKPPDHGTVGPVAVDPDRPQ
jgi:hypothetical protein